MKILRSSLFTPCGELICDDSCQEEVFQKQGQYRYYNERHSKALAIYHILLNKEHFVELSLFQNSSGFVLFHGITMRSADAKR